ncbi:MAG TPA: hypothetical protein VGR62_08530 [Candidatus Binatia bacterium]|jgi:outer membrane protein assembly factor BamB|nr:hypothetical protein [Candidatus Binatia bacterium]
MNCDRKLSTARLMLMGVLATALLLDPRSGSAWERRVAKTYQVQMLRVDDRGDLYAAVSLDPLYTNGQTTALVKLRSRDGAERWRQIVPTAGPQVDRGAHVTGIGTQPSGDAVIVSTASNSRGHDVIRFARHDSRTGRARWRRTVRSDTADGYAEAFGAAVDRAGDVVAAGTITRGPAAIRYEAEDLFVVKLSGDDGSELWRYQLDGGANVGDGANSVAVDSHDDVIVAGGVRTGRNATDGVAFVMKHAASTGDVLWRTNLPEGGSVMSITRADDVILGGRLAVSLVRGNSGEVMWETPFPAIGNVYDARELPSGDIVVFGLESYAVEKLFIARLDGTTGAEQWRTAIDDVFTLGGSLLAVVDPARLVVGGQRTAVPGTCYDAFSAEFDAVSGAPIASQTYDGTTVALGCEVDCPGEGPGRCTPGYGSDKDETFAVAAAPNGGIIVAGSLSDGHLGRPRGFVATIPSP